MTTKLPKLPGLPEAVAYCESNNPHNDDAFAWPGTDRKDYHTTQLYDADQMQAYAREAVADALRPTGDNAEHVRVLEDFLNDQHWSPELSKANDALAALTAAIAALSQPSVVVTDIMVQAGLDAAIDASNARLARYSVVRAILTAALTQGAANER